jgi:uncharacterized protein
MERLLLFAFVGFLAQLVDGALGMGYGATSTTILLAAGTVPATAAASVMLAQCGTTLVSGFSHWRFGNVDWRIVRTLALPGAVTGFAGATILSNIDAGVATPYVTGFLFLLGAFVLARFAFGMTRTGARHSPLFLRFLGGIAGFFNSSGGGWGPIATPSLLANGALQPRLVVGSVSAAEFIVTVSTSVGFLFALSRDQYELGLTGALLVGGMVAAPVAAYLVRFFHARVLGTLVGAIILLTNARTGSKVLEVEGLPRTLTYVAILVVVAVALVRVRRAIAREATGEPEPDLALPVEEPAER